MVKVRIMYPIISFEEEQVEVSPQEWETIQEEMGTAERASWIRETLFQKQEDGSLPGWKIPLGREEIEGFLDVGSARIEKIT